MNCLTAFEADGLGFRMPLAFASSAEIDDLTGCALTAVAGNAAGATVDGIAVADGLDAIVVTFAAGDLAVGDWNIQVRVIPPASSGITVVPVVAVTILESY